MGNVILIMVLVSVRLVGLELFVPIDAQLAPLGKTVVKYVSASMVLTVII